MVVRCLRNTRIETLKKTCVLRECNTQILSGKQGPQLLFSPIKTCQSGPLTKKTERPSSAQSPITKKTEMTSDPFVEKPLRGDQVSSWGYRGKPLPSVEIRSLRGGKQSTALRRDEIRSEQGKGENNQQIKDEDLLCVGASRREERGNQPTD